MIIHKFFLAKFAKRSRSTVLYARKTSAKREKEYDMSFFLS